MKQKMKYVFCSLCSEELKEFPRLWISLKRGGKYFRNLANRGVTKAIMNWTTRITLSLRFPWTNSFLGKREKEWTYITNSFLAMDWLHLTPQGHASFSPFSRLTYDLYQLNLKWQIPEQKNLLIFHKLINYQVVYIIEILVLGMISRG